MVSHTSIVKATLWFMGVTYAFNEIRSYLKEGRKEFEACNAIARGEAEASFQAGISSTIQVAKEARRTRCSTRVLRHMIKKLHS